MKRTILCIVIITSLFGLLSCEKEKIKGRNESYHHPEQLPPFNGIRIEMDCELRISDPADRPFNSNLLTNAKYWIDVFAQNNISDAIDKSIINGNLVLRLKEGVHIYNYDTIVVHVGTPDLSYLDLRGPGSVSINFRDAVLRNYLDCANFSSGTIVFQSLNYNYLKLTQSHAGYIFADNTGTAKMVTLLNSGSGRINLLKTLADSVRAIISGKGDVSVSVKELLDGTISGSGNLYYIDKAVPKDTLPPKLVIKSNITGSGSIIRL